MLELKDLELNIKGKEILSNVSFKAKKGCITVLIGKNGSGKSSILACINGTKKYSGKILLCEKDIRTFKSKEKARLVSFLPQIMPGTALNVRELVSLGRNPHTGSMGILSPQDKKAVSEALKMTDTEKFADRSVATLSGGEMRRAFIALLLAQETPLLILDEPTSYLDASAAKEICSLLRSLSKEHGKTVLTVMHDLSEAMELADDIAVLCEGRSVFYGEKQELTKTNIIENRFGVCRFEAHDIQKEHKRIFFS